MSTESKLRELNEFGQKILASISTANQRLVEASAAKNKSLIVGDKNGNPISVPAKEILKKMQK